MARAKAADKPTLNDCRDWAAELDGIWSSGRSGGLARRQDEEQDLYYQRFALQVMENSRAVRVGSAPSDVDASIDAIVPLDLRVRVQPARQRQKYVDQAELLTRGGQSLLRLWRQRKDVLRFIASDQCLMACGVARVLFDDRVWPAEMPPLGSSWVDDAQALEEWEVQKRRDVPIVLQHRPARNVRWKLDEDGRPLIVVEDYFTTVLEARRVFGYLAPATAILLKRTSREYVRIQDIWVGGYRCVLIENEPVFPVGGRGTYQGVVPHGYPEIPYVFAPFREMPGDWPEERYRGVLTNQRSVYPAESQAVTMHMTMLEFNAWRTFVAHTRDQRDLEIRPGRVVEIDKRLGEYLELLQGEPVSPEIIQTAQVLQGYRMQNGVGQLGMGGGQDQARSAQQVMAQQSLADKKIMPARESLETLCSNSLRLAMMIIQEVIQQPVTLPSPGRDNDGRWLGQVRITPQDIQSYWDKFEVSFSRRLDPAQLEQAKALAALAEANWMPWRTSVELSGYCDTPSEWEDALMIQAAERQPFLLEVAVLEMLEATYGGDAKNQWIVDQYRAHLAQERQQQQQPPQIGPAGMPGGMGNPTNTLAGMANTQVNPPAAMGTGGPPPQGGAPPMQQMPLPHRRGNQGGAGRPFRPTGMEGQ